MTEWLAYILAFAIGLGVAAICYFAAFSLVMGQTVSLSVAGFVGLVVILPMMAGAAVFGLVYPRWSQVRLTGGDWVNGAAFTFTATVMCAGLILSRAMGELAALMLLIALLFAGGRVLLARKRDV